MVEVEVNGKKVKVTNFHQTLIDNNSGRLTNEEMTKICIELFNGGIDSVIVEVEVLLAGMLERRGRVIVWIMVG